LPAFRSSSSWWPHEPLKPVKQPVFGSSGRQCSRCGRWFDWGNYYRKSGGYRDVCTKCLDKAPAADDLPREASEGLRSASAAPVGTSVPQGTERP
jgi:hypothetical protein